MGAYGIVFVPSLFFKLSRKKRKKGGQPMAAVGKMYLNTTQFENVVLDRLMSDGEVRQWAFQAKQNEKQR